MIRFLALQVVSQDQYIASRTGRKEHSDVYKRQAIRYALHRESKGTGYLCHWHISCVQWVLVGFVRLKLDITKSVIPFSWKSIVIFFNAQKKVMILIHL